MEERESDQEGKKKLKKKSVKVMLLPEVNKLYPQIDFYEHSFWTFIFTFPTTNVLTLNEACQRISMYYILVYTVEQYT